jgi:beta-N-acetylhexosaminidase
MDFKTNLLGQLFIFDFEGFSPSEEFMRFFKNWNLGGVILFSENIQSLNQLKELIIKIKSSSSILPFIMIDQEGGSKNRIAKNFPTFPSNKYYGDRDDQKGMYQAYKTTARSLVELGINVNLAPVVDVLTNRENRVIRERSFGNNPQKVSTYCRIAIDAIHKGGVLACAKHFPGIGDIDMDPHYEMPNNRNSKKRFEKIDFPPFKAAIDSKTDFIMTTHVKCPNLDSKKPASLSSAICTEILKRDLGYKGLVITDDMNMGAIKKNYDILEACEEAYLAGNDLILLSHEHEKQPQVLERFLKLLKDGKIRKDDLAKTIQRILLKKKNDLV